MDSETDAELLAAAATAPQAFERLVVRHHRALHRYVARRIGAHDAEDIVSETVAIAFAQRGRYDSSYPDALPWLYGIATNLLRRHRRQEAAELRAFAKHGVDPIGSGVDGDLSVGPALAAALSAMRPRHRDVLLLHSLVGLSHDEIARALGAPVGSVKAWLHMARQVGTRELALRGIAPPSVLPPPRTQGGHS